MVLMDYPSVVETKHHVLIVHIDKNIIQIKNNETVITSLDL